MAKTLILLAVLSCAASSVPAAEAINLPSTVLARRFVSTSLRIGRKVLQDHHKALPLVQDAIPDRSDSRQLLSEDCGNPCGVICCQAYEACLAVPMLGQFCFDYSTVTQSSAYGSNSGTGLYKHSAMGLSEP